MTKRTDNSSPAARGEEAARNDVTRALALKEAAKLLQRPWATQMGGIGISRLYLVTRPTEHSTVADLLVPIETWRDLANQFAGGLDPDDIIGTYDNKMSAEMLAGDLVEVASRTRS